jgi:hypothetical protein
MTNYVLVGDVHSQAPKLATAVNWIQDNVEDYHIIQGGDLFDSRTDESDSVGVLEIIRSLGDRVTVIHSNHFWKLYRNLSNPELERNECIVRTIEDFDAAYSSSWKEDMISWIDSLPYGLVVRDSNNLEYRMSHAYWSGQLYVPEHYEGMYKVFVVSNKTRGQMLYGLQKKGGINERVEWWNQPYNNKFVRVAFHYHTISIDPDGENGNRHIVLDGSCGSDGGVLPVYQLNSRILTTF